MNDVRAIVSDLDGTLFAADHELSSRTTEVLRSARRSGLVASYVAGLL